jgi:hypothetical protein
VSTDATEARDEALDHVERGADPEWLRAARVAVGVLADQGRQFSADDVWALLDGAGVDRPREPRALGPVIKAAVQSGRIVRVGWANSSRASRHAAPIAHYRSRT